MPAPSPTPTEQPTRLVTEAEAICNLLMDMDVTLVARLDSEELLFQVGNSTTNGAIDLMKIARERFDADAEFREDMIGHLGAMGDYVAAAPGVDTDLKTADAMTLTKALTGAGLLPEIHRPKPGVVGLCYLPIPERKIAPNAHLLMRLATDRFNYEPGFDEAMPAFLSQFEHPRA